MSSRGSRTAGCSETKLAIGRLTALCVVALLGTLISGCGSSRDSGAWVAEPIEWTVWSFPSPLKVRIAGSVDYCIGEPRPRIADAKVTYADPRIYITAILTRPAMVHSGDGGAGRGTCAGLGLFVRKTVRLDRPVRGSVLFDASVDPPIERWPDG